MPMLERFLSATIKYLKKKQKVLRKKRRSKRKKPRLTKRRVVKRPSRSRRAKKASGGKRRSLISGLFRKTTAKAALNVKKDAQPKLKKVGVITHFFSRIQVVVIRLIGPLKVGDQILIKGKTVNFKQKVRSLQIESVDVLSAKKGDLIGLKVKKKAKEGDEVFLLP